MLQTLRRPAGIAQAWLWPVIIVASALAAGGLVYAGIAGPLRVGIVLWFLLICPGMAFVRLLRVADLATELMLAIGLSLALDALVAIGMLYGQLWSPSWGLAGLIGASLVGVAAQLVWRPALSHTPLEN